MSGETDYWDHSLSVEDVFLVRMKSFEPEVFHIKMPVSSWLLTGGLHRIHESHWQMVSAVVRPGGAEIKSEGMSWVTLVRVDPAR